MTLEKVLEIAHRYGCLELGNTRWVFSEDGLHRFVQEITEKEEHNDLIAEAIEVLRRQVKPVLKSRLQSKTPLTDDEISKVAAEAPPVHPWLIQGDVTLGHVRIMTTAFARAIEQKIWEKAE